MGIMTTADVLAERAKQLPEDIAREVLDFMEFLSHKRQHQQPAEGYVCEYGYSHTPNQETIDAINTPDSELLHYNSFADFLEEVAHETA